MTSRALSWNSQVDRVQRFVDRAEISNEIGHAQRHYEPRQDRRVFQPLSGRFSPWCLVLGPWSVVRPWSSRSLVPEIYAEVARGLAAAGGRRGEPHHARDDDHLHGHRYEAWPEEDRVAER